MFSTAIETRFLFWDLFSLFFFEDLILFMRFFLASSFFMRWIFIISFFKYLDSIYLYDSLKFSIDLKNILENESRYFNKLKIIFLYFWLFLSDIFVFIEFDLSINIPFKSLNAFILVLSSKFFLFSSNFFDWRFIFWFSLFWTYLYLNKASLFNVCIFFSMIPSSSSSDKIKSVYPDDSFFLKLSSFL